MAWAQVTILYDAFGKATGMQKDWGYAALVECGGKRILFDSGNNPEVLAHNAGAAGADLSQIDFVVMSHRHGDHMGGLTHLLRVNPRAKIYAPKEAFGVYGSDLPGTFYRRETSLPPEQRYYDGTPPEVVRLGSAWPGADFQLVDRDTEVAAGVHLIALVSDKPGTLEMRELSLCIDTGSGLVILVGCSHPGIDRIAGVAAAMDPHIRLVAGGLHLLASGDGEIARVVAELHDRYKVDYVAPGHCTGEPAFAALKQAFGDHYLFAGVGARVSLTEARAAGRSGGGLGR